MLPDVLKLGRIDLEFVPVVERQNDLACVEQRPGRVPLKRQKALRRISQGEGVLEATGQKQGMVFSVPLVVPPADEQWFLGLFDAQSRVRVLLIIVLPEVAAFRAVVNGL